MEKWVKRIRPEISISRLFFKNKRRLILNSRRRVVRKRERKRFKKYIKEEEPSSQANEVDSGKRPQ